MNAEFEVVVCWRPTFWHRYATNAVKPSATPQPASTRAESVGRAAGPRHPRRSARGRSAAPPMAKRTSTKPVAVRSSSASWTIVKVAPYRKLATTSASSG
jgi:hypothetical protein